MTHKIAGQCSNCGSVVYVAKYFYSMYPPTPECLKCGYVAETKYPVIPMVKPESLKDKGTKQQQLPFVPMTPQQKSEVQEKIAETREILKKIQSEQQQSEVKTLQEEKIADMEKSIDRLERMMIVAAEALTEIKRKLTPASENVEDDESVRVEKE